MVSPTTQKIFIVAVVLLLLGFLGYRMFVEPTVALESDSVLSDTEIASQDILILVDKLEAITIDQNLFSEPMFRNLKDFSQTIFPEAQGRINPFATIGSDGSFSVNTGRQATSTGAR